MINHFVYCSPNLHPERKHSNVYNVLFFFIIMGINNRLFPIFIDESNYMYNKKHHLCIGISVRSVYNTTSHASYTVLHNLLEMFSMLIHLRLPTSQLVLFSVEHKGADFSDMNVLSSRLVCLALLQTLVGAH